MTTQQNKALYISEQLQKASLTPAGIAGVLINLDCESRIDPINCENRIHNDLHISDEEYTRRVDSGEWTDFITDFGKHYGYGIAQWTLASRKEKMLKYHRARNVSIGDFKTQVSFMIEEMRTDFPSVWSLLTKSDNPYNCAWQVCRWYENPANAVAQADYRAGRAHEWYEFLMAHSGEQSTYSQEQPTQQREEDSSMKTGKGLAEYAIAQLGKPYWWGTFGQTATPALLQQKRAQYPDYYQALDFNSQFGQKVHDCVGLVKGYRWCDTPDSEPTYVGSQDVAVSGLYNQCGRKGTLSNMPDIPGVCVFQADMGHVGVYIGDGYVVEAMGHAYGVVKTELHKRNWSLWGMPAWLSYDGSSPATSPSQSTTQPTQQFKTMKTDLPLLIKGAKGIPVAKLQHLLLLESTCKDLLDTSGGADGSFGMATENAVKKYQQEKGLEVDGEVGSQTWASLITT